MNDQQWQPIETAPKGQVILGCSVGDWPRITWWNPRYQKWMTEVHPYNDIQPTHWMPMLELPK